MTLFNRHEKCVGLTLWRFGRRNVEIWYCPRGYEIKPHSHPNERIELMYIFGKTTFFRRKPDYNFAGYWLPQEESFKPKWYHIFRCFTVDYGQIHWFKVSNLPLIFINFSKFWQGYKPTSAAIDFKPI